MVLPQGAYRFRVIAESVGTSTEYGAAEAFASVMHGLYYEGSKENVAIVATTKLSGATSFDYVESVSRALAKRCFE